MTAAAAMNGNWQSDEYLDNRREMIRQIIELLMKNKNKHVSDEQLRRLPEIAKHLELALFRKARSFDDYMDISTLRSRLRLIAMEVSRKASKNHGGRSNNDRQWSRYRSHF
ncbi:TAZ zinc finger [Fragilaria crotonensis]|nr:TAZ zinc finger [Fragilaria crotonensis]